MRKEGAMSLMLGSTVSRKRHSLWFSPPDKALPSFCEHRPTISVVLQYGFFSGARLAPPLHGQQTDPRREREEVNPRIRLSNHRALLRKSCTTIG